jgi:hypothetical protein
MTTDSTILEYFILVDVLALLGSFITILFTWMNSEDRKMFWKAAFVPWIIFIPKCHLPENRKLVFKCNLILMTSLTVFILFVALK